MPTNNWRKDKARALKLLKEVVLPNWSWLRDRIIILEDKDAPLCLCLDKELATDAILLIGSNAYTGLSIRVQGDGKNWGTFTCRYKRDSGEKTEYEKITEAIKNRTRYPEFCLQAYTDGEKLLGAAVGDWVDIMEAIKKNPKTKRVDNAEFFYVYWSEVYRVKKWDKEEAEPFKQEILE